MELVIESIDQLPETARLLLDHAADRKKWLFTGEIGAGKTTLIQSICDILGVKDKVTSPTFSLINEYSITNKQGQSSQLSHIDLYRLNKLEEAVDIGIEDYLYDENYCFIEWPDLIRPILPDNVVEIKLEIIENSKRKIIFL